MNEGDTSEGRARVRRNIRHLWATFFVFTVSTTVLLVWLRNMPGGPEETGAGRALLYWGFMALWIVGFLFSLAVWFTLRQAEDSSNALPVALWCLTAVFGVGAMMDPIMARASGRLSQNERSASGCLRELAGAEREFRAKHGDDSPLNGFWVADVSTLYTFVPKEGQDALKLIALSVATADSAALKAGDVPRARSIESYGLRTPKAGYWYRALTYYEEPSGKRVPYHTGSRQNAEHFGFCGYPATTSAGLRTFIINEEKTIFWKKLNSAAVDTFPADPERDGWKRLE